MRSDQRKEIQELIDILIEHDLHEIELERKGTRIRLRREQSIPHPGQSLTPPVHPPTTEFSARQPTPITGDPSHFLTVTSPIVGTFYRSPSPDADSYVEEGDFVKKGRVLCIVEAMKLMNEIESETDGKIVKILVESATPVEYGQPLFLIDPTAAP